ncbi:LysE family translocator [Cognatiluteimonas profundi]|uniref:LysE family translocator n=1 Tax=Cognatiluteimonas profundi TaxID=2594501 RepID=UPI00131D8CFF|nr:LysE family translocator [Lysobacter profundi]
MTDTSHLWLFFVLVFGVVLLPGLDMAYVMASALVGGRRAGIAATAGIVAGGVVHVTMGALGIMAVLRLFPAAFNAVLLAGAFYIAWIGISLLRSRAMFGELPAQRLRTQAATFRQGMLTSLLNPKAYLFMLAIFPQFLKPQYGLPWLQAVVLWLIIAITQTVVYGGMALAGDRVRGALATRPATGAVLAKLVGAILLATAFYTAFEGWRMR